MVRASKHADIIIHCAAVINEKNPRKYNEVNLQGTKNILRAAKKNKVKKFIYISSWATNPQAGNYARSKYLAELAVKKMASKYIIIRPADIYSKKQSHLKNLINLIKKLPVIPIIGDGNYQISPVYVNDVSEIIIKLIDTGKRNGIYTVTGPKIYSFKQIVKLICQTLRQQKPLIHLPYKLIYPLIYFADKLNLNLPLDKEKYLRLITPKNEDNIINYAELGIRPMRFEEALRNFFIQ